MYLLSLFVFMVLCIGFMIVSVGGGFAAVTFLIDMPSILMLILILVPMLLNAGLLKDLNNAFRLGAKRKIQAEKMELTRAAEAVSFTMKALWAAGIFSVILQFIVVMIKVAPRAEEAFIYTAVSLLPLCYASFFVILLLPLKSRLEMQLKVLCEKNINNANVDNAAVIPATVDVDDVKLVGVKADNVNAEGSEIQHMEQEYEGINGEKVDE